MGAEVDKGDASTTALDCEHRQLEKVIGTGVMHVKAGGKLLDIHLAGEFGENYGSEARGGSRLVGGLDKDLGVGGDGGHAAGLGTMRVVGQEDGREILRNLLRDFAR